MRLPARTLDLPPGPIDALNARARALRDAGAPVISLGQAVPSFPPPAALLDAARAALSDPATHLYSADAGLPALRAAWSACLAARGLGVDPERELVLTPGANQAALLALLTLLEPGARVLLPAPYYLNHDGAVRIAGGVPVEVPLDPAGGFALTLDRVLPYLDPPPAALVAVTPNNPTGAVYDAGELERIAEACAARRVVMLVDETYAEFVYAGAQHFNPAQRADLRSHVLTVGSFSKTFGITGWRLGYLAGPAAFIEHALKVQDSLVICAPVIAQRAVLGALPTMGATLTEWRARLDERRQLMAARLAAIPALSWPGARGALFAFVQVPGRRDVAQLARDLLEREYLVAVPGTAFGRYGEGYLRLAYGAVELPELEEACARLARYFA